MSSSPTSEATTPVVEAQPMAAPVVAPVALPPDPSELARKASSEIPVLNQLVEPLEMVFVAYTQYVAPKRGMEVTPSDVQAAIEELEIAGVATKANIKAAVDIIRQALQEHWKDLNDRFVAATHDTEIDPNKPLSLTDLTNRLTAEQNEQHTNIARSIELRGMVKTVRERLGLASPTAPSDKVPEDHKEKRGGLLGGLRDLGGALGSTFIASSSEKDAPVEKPVSAPVEEVSVDNSIWTEIPVWTDDDLKVKKFKIIVYRKATEKDVDPALAWSRINGLKVSNAEVEELLETMEQFAGKQLTQSEHILQEANSSFGDFKQEIEAVARMHGVLDAVKAFFFSA